MTDLPRCLITTLELPKCDMKGQDAERLVGVLTLCPALTHLDLSDNSDFGAAGADRLAGVLGQCRELVHNKIGSGGTEILGGVLSQCPALDHLNLSENKIEAGGTESLARVLCCGSTQRYLTSISPAMGSKELGRRGLEECWGSVQR